MVGGQLLQVNVIGQPHRRYQPSMRHPSSAVAHHSVSDNRVPSRRRVSLTWPVSEGLERLGHPQYPVPASRQRFTPQVSGYVNLSHPHRLRRDSWDGLTDRQYVVTGADYPRG